MSLARTCLAVLLVGAALACAGPGEPSVATAAAAASVPLSDAVVEAACGQCQFGLPGPGCDLAVRVDGRAAFVEGTGIDDHGDAHADDGFCNAVRHARVRGEFVGDHFEASSFELLGDEPR